SIDQRSSSQNPRSTVGTTTEIYDYLRLLFARVGIPHCPTCGREIKKQTVDQIVDRITAKAKGHAATLIAPLVRDQKGEHKHLLDEIRRAGYSRVRFDGIVYDVDEMERLTIDKQKKHAVEVVIDTITVTADKDDRTRLTEAVEAALKLGRGLVMAEIASGNSSTTAMAGQASSEQMLFSQHFSCPTCGVDLPEIEPRTFSFNSPHGACKECSGLGTKLEVDPELVVLNPRLTIAQGAIRPWARLTGQHWLFEELVACAQKNGFSVHVPFATLTKEQQKIVLSGSRADGYEGVIPNLERRYKETDSDYMRGEIERYMRVYACPLCKGKRLRPEALAVTVGNTSIAAIVTMTITDAAKFFAALKLSVRETTIGKQILKEINARLHFLQNVGLNYLTLDRTTASLSGGEAQRIRLATQIGSALVGVTYILDEPSIGLHQRDNDRLIATLKSLRDLGNSVIVVEHDEATIEAADHVVDIGPGAGEHGGHIIAEGTPDAIKKNNASITGKYLAGKLSIDEPKHYRKGNGKKLVIKGAREFNLKNIDVEIPLGKFVCITGVSGSGKSTLMTDILARALASHFYRAKDLPGDHDKIVGIENIDKVITIDQSPIGRTPRSNPATYTGAFTPIRDLYTMLPEARIRGYKAGRFSFNVVGGRCEACQGEGMVQIAMQFLPDVYVECEECHGKRYNREALEIFYNGKTIADVLDMTVEKASTFFTNIPAIHSKLTTLEEVGLGYMKLGQPATTLSGGEAQRIKLATELSRRATGKTLYILDEPTTGLHFDDVKRLLHVLQKLVEKGNTILIIEHNLDVIKSVDWIIDLGPDGGAKGGQLVAAGTPRDVAKVKESYTGQFLKKVLKAK
ncbi:MAG: excinuclease ABC subunit UvrA, partial [bacterium]|nr:excinuclease ABC subunit UvrA [bacterium]